jgi:hypothetical protein
MLNKIVLISVLLIISKYTYLWLFQTKYEITADEAKRIG